MTQAEANTIQAALAYRDIRIAQQQQHISPAIQEHAEQRLLEAAERVAKERGGS